MDKKIISFDLGTGGNKASLYDVYGNCLASAFVPYTQVLINTHKEKGKLKVDHT
jgi:sugar (pentulose or hexulose) kinase